MDKRPKYFSKEQPGQCPNCGAEKVVSILYGYPSEKLEEIAIAGEVVLGGCVSTDCDPSWQCSSCGMHIYHEKLRSRFRKNQNAFYYVDTTDDWVKSVHPWDRS